MAWYIGAKSEILALYWYRGCCCAGHYPADNSCATETDCYCYCIGQRRQQVCQRHQFYFISINIFSFDLPIIFTKSSFFSNSRAVSSIYSTVFFPILPWIFQIAVTIFAIIVGLYLASIGQPVNQVLRLSEDTNCQCTGAAQYYKVSID